MALTDNLISFWPINEVSGNRADAVVATGNTLTDNNTVTSTTGKVYSLAGQFTSANSESLSHTDNASLSVGGTAFSFMIWLYADTVASGQEVVSKDDTGTNREYNILINGTQFEFDTWTTLGGVGLASVSASTFGAVPTATWVMLVCTSDQTNNKISVNAGTQNSVGAVNAGVNGAAPFVVGARQSAGFWDGRIGPVGFWKRALSTTEITQLYNAGIGMTYEQMLGWGKLLGQELFRLVVP